MADGLLKCWGANDYAQLGLGLIGSSHGGQMGQMGDSLLAVDLGL